MTHNDIAELLGAWALDAVDRDEARLVEAHLEECPRCRAEVAQHLEVAAMLANAGGDAPDGLWDRIAASLDEEPPALDMAPVVAIEEAARQRSERPGRSRAAERSGRSARAGGGSRTFRARTVAVVGVAAAIVIAALGFEVQRLDHRTNRLAAQVSAQQGEARIGSLTARAGTSEVVLRDSEGQTVATAYLPPTGDAVVDLRALPPLPAGKEYQLWAVEGPDKVSLRLLGSRPDIVDFRMAPGVRALAITAERVGGVVVTEQAPVAVGNITA